VHEGKSEYGNRALTWSNIGRHEQKNKENRASITMTTQATGGISSFWLLEQ